jgi:DNA-binding transcriptional LysR family regulator
MRNNHMDRLEAMNAFVAVADLRGFAPASRRLGISASAATRMVAALENNLGIRLLTRTTRSVTLTSAGARFLERARRILTDVAEAESAAQQERTTPTGRFVVAAPQMFGRLHVAPIMSAYLAKYPQVQGELTLADRIVNLVDDGVDVAIRIGFLEDSSLVARHVGATRRVVVASPAYLARHKKIHKPADLLEHKLIQCTALAPLPEWRFFEGSKESRVSYTPAYVTNSADAAIAHAQRAGGLTMILAYQVVEAVRARKLRVVLANFEPPPMPIHVVFPTTRLLSAKVRAFTDLVAASCDWRFVDL